MDQEVILADKSETIKIWMKTTDWAGELTDLSGMAIKKPSTRQYKDSGQNTTVNLMPPFCWTSWTTCRPQTHTGPLRPKQP